MNFDRFVGLASAVGILLILTIVIAAAEPNFSLKQWQPLMAALIALGAATLAYRSAMSKVDLDREIHLLERKRRQLGAFLKLRTEITNVQARVITVAVDLQNGLDATAKSGDADDFDLTELKLTEMISFKRIWKSLDLFLGKFIDQLVALEVSLDLLEALAAKKYRVIGKDVPHELIGMLDALEQLRFDCNGLANDLDIEIEKMKQL
jgi:hypothetical protein